MRFFLFFVCFIQQMSDLKNDFEFMSETCVRELYELIDKEVSCVNSKVIFFKEEREKIFKVF